MKIVTAAEMREIDQAAGSTYGVPEVVLMENAGVQAAHETKRLLQGVEDKAIVIFCGSGNNGGDGFVAARHLANLGAKVKVFLLGDLQQFALEVSQSRFHCGLPVGAFGVRCACAARRPR